MSRMSTLERERTILTTQIEELEDLVKSKKSWLRNVEAQIDAERRQEALFAG